MPDPRAVAPLFVLPAARVAEETQRAAERSILDDEWRGRLRALLGRCGVGYLAGLVSAYASLHLRGEYAQMALWAGLFIGNGVPLAMLYEFWVKENA